MPMAETQHGEVAGGEQPSAAMSQIQRPRRSPRRAASIPVWVRREGKGPTWEEETETQVLSRYGACLECRHAVEAGGRSEEHTSELQSRLHLVCRLLLEKKKKQQQCRVRSRYELSEL